MKTTFAARSRLIVGYVLMAVATHSQAGLTDLATAPLQTSTPSLVKPNIFYVLDDSGSMDWDFLPDWASYGCSGTTSSVAFSSGSSIPAALTHNAKFNGVYYDPAVTYTPPLKYDGSSYTSMTSANTSSWTKVPNDGFGVQTPSTGSCNISGASGSSATSTQNLTSTTTTGSGSSAVTTANYSYYYVFTAGEWCTTSAQKSCSTSATSTQYPAYLRWCSDKALTNCQITHIDTAPSGGSKYQYYRYPGQAAVSGANSAVPGSNTRTDILSTVTSYTKAGTRTDCAGATSCTYAEEMTNFANWWAYYRTRMQMTKSAATFAFANIDTRFRIGYMSINNNTGSDFLNINDVTTTSGGQKSQWYSKFTAANPNNGTGLRVALSTAGRMYAGKLTGSQKLWAKEASGSSTAVTVTDPMQYACQRNYTIVSTDGYWNDTSNPVQIDGSTVIGDADGDGTSNTLADVAYYYFNTDIRDTSLGNATNTSGTNVAVSASGANSRQYMSTYTLGLGASGYMQYQSGYATASSGDYYDVIKAVKISAITDGTCSWLTSGTCTWPVPVSNTQTTVDDLWHAAVNGGGTYYSAGNPNELQSALTDLLNSVTADASSAAAANVSQINLSSSTDTYVYGSNFCSAKWFGDLQAYKLDSQTGNIASSPTWAESGAGKDCENAATTTPLTPALDVISFSARTIYTYNSATNALISFDWASLPSTMQAYFKVAAIGSLAQMCASGSTCLSSTAKVDSTGSGQVGVGGYNLVNFLRGDRSNEGSSNSKYYFPRTHVLGDIVNSSAVYVGAPNLNYIDSGYAAYKTSKASRQGVVYVGANDGMLHAFNASNGSELWAYIPSMLLPNLYKLADKNYASNHVAYVDASPVSADVYINSGWRTILVGGLGRGGRGVYALDVTSPTAPTILWEFTNDTSKSSPYIVDADLGYTYGTPVVTKLSDGTWVVLVTSGYNNVYDSSQASGSANAGSGHGVLWVLNAATGAIIQKFDNATGSSSGSTLPTGCTVQPCPSGLSKIVGYIDSPTNNMATQVYGGDMLGNLWRFDLTGLTGTVSTTTLQPQLLTSLTDPSGNRQPVTTTPVLARINSNRIVYVGTGSYMGVSDISSTQTQTVYAIKDPLTKTSSPTTSPVYASPRSNTCGSTATPNCFMKQILSTSFPRTVTSSVSYSMSFANMGGWFEDLSMSGERVNVDPALGLGVFVFTTNIPSSSDACAPGGSSYINYVDYRTGLAVAGGTDAGIVLSTTNMASATVLIKTAAGALEGITSVGSSASSSTGSNNGGNNGQGLNKTPFRTPPFASGTRRVSWRELIVGQ